MGNEKIQTLIVGLPIYLLGFILITQFFY